jgi:peptidylprolyl isomerase
MARAQSGNRVYIHYTGRLEDGTVFDSSTGRDPLAFTLGSGQVIAGFDAAVQGMAVGESCTTVIPPVEGYGEHRSELEIEVPMEHLPEGYTPEVGGELQMTTSQGQPVPVRVIRVQDTSVTLDANHPLAGKVLTFEIELVSIG